MTTYLVAPKSKVYHLTEDGQHSLCGETIRYGLAYKPPGGRQCPYCGSSDRYDEVGEEMAARLSRAELAFQIEQKRMTGLNHLRFGLRAAHLTATKRLPVKPAT